jgi:hypothetical protein
VTELTQDARARRLAWVALGFAGVALALVLVRWLVWGALAWTSTALLLGLTANVGPAALGWWRTRPGLARALAGASLALVLVMLAILLGGARWLAR